MTADTCWDCRRNDGSVKRLDLLAQRAAIHALGIHGGPTDFARACDAYQAAIIRRDAHRDTHARGAA